MAEKTKKAKVAASKADAPAFTKAQILASRKYAGRRDFLSVNLDDNKRYTHADLDELLIKFFGKTVK